MSHRHLIQKARVRNELGLFLLRQAQGPVPTLTRYKCHRGLSVRLVFFRAIRVIRFIRDPMGTQMGRDRSPTTASHLLIHDPRDPDADFVQNHEGQRHEEL